MFLTRLHYTNDVHLNILHGKPIRRAMARSGRVPDSLSTTKICNQNGIHSTDCKPSKIVYCPLEMCVKLYQRLDDDDALKGSVCRGVRRSYTALYGRCGEKKFNFFTTGRISTAGKKQLAVWRYKRHRLVEKPAHKS